MSAPGTSATNPSSSVGDSLNVMRGSLSQAIANVAANRFDFDRASEAALDVLVQLLQAHLSDLAFSSRVFAESAGRTSVQLPDVLAANFELGRTRVELEEFLADEFRSNPLPSVSAPRQAAGASASHGLRVGEPKPVGSHVYDFLPPAPDPHTYIRTGVVVEPESSYERVRIAEAERRRAAAGALVDLLLRSQPRLPLFAAHEQKLRVQAKQFVDETRRLKAERERKRLAHDDDDERETIENGEHSTLPGRLFSDSEGESAASSEKRTRLDQDTDEGLKWSLPETIESNVRRAMPRYCYVFHPSPDRRPYLAALLGSNYDEGAGKKSGSSSDPSAV